MRIMAYGRNLEVLHPLLEQYSVQIDTANPELIISYGGDGTLLGAEREFPEVPKCPIRDSQSSQKCKHHDERSVLDALFSGQLRTTELIKVEGRHENGDTRTCGINDVVIDRKNQASAIRYRLWINDLLYARHIVGDGIVLSTPFGSSGYYRSITHSLFTLGLGLAFNNATEAVNHLVIEQTSKITVEIVRGPAIMFADNDPRREHLAEGDRVVLSRASSRAKVVGLDIFRCPECYWLRHHHKRPLVPLANV